MSRRTRDIFSGIVIMTEYPLYLSYSALIQASRPLSNTLIAQAIAKPIPTEGVRQVFGGLRVGR